MIQDTYTYMTERKALLACTEQDMRSALWTLFERGQIDHDQYRSLMRNLGN